MPGSRGPGRDRQSPRAQLPLSATLPDEPDLVPAERFEALANLLLAEHAADLDLRELHIFGAVGLTVDGKIFALLVQDRLVVKLPRTRVDALEASGAGDRFEPAPGRPWKEWLSLAPHADEDWLELSREALAFVSPRGR